MSTIAVRDGIMAADSLFNSEGNRRCGHKIRTLPDGRLVGFAGGLEDCDKLIDWFVGDRKAPPQFINYGDEKPSARLLVLSREGLQLVSQWGLIDRITEPFWAIGSGSSAALGAMHAGMTAADAVRIAALVDPDTGGEIFSVRYGGESGENTTP